MSENRSSLRCAQSEALVFIEVIPLCQIDSYEAVRPEDVILCCAAYAAGVEQPTGGLPARCATIMPCVKAASLMEEVGHVVF